MFGKASTLLKTTKLLSNTNKFPNFTRNSHAWNYRQGGPTPSKTVVVTAEITSAITWWWILWHIFTEPAHIYGEFAYPDARTWTNKELGIPDDSPVPED